MLEGKTSTYPTFQCPNCRAYWDLTADVDVEMDDESEDSISNDAVASTEEATAAVTITTTATEMSPPEPIRTSGLLSRRQATNPDSPEINSVSGAIDMPQRNSSTGSRLEPTRTETPDGERIINGEGPLTPRNDVGPFILDGSAGRASGRRVVAIPEVTGASAS